MPKKVSCIRNGIAVIEIDDLLTVLEYRFLKLLALFRVNEHHSLDYIRAGSKVFSFSSHLLFNFNSFLVYNSL